MAVPSAEHAPHKDWWAKRHSHSSRSRISRRIRHVGDQLFHAACDGVPWTRQNARNKCHEPLSSTSGAKRPPTPASDDSPGAQDLQLSHRFSALVFLVRRQRRGHDGWSHFHPHSIFPERGLFGPTRTSVRVCAADEQSFECFRHACCHISLLSPLESPLFNRLQ